MIRAGHRYNRKCELGTERSGHGSSSVSVVADGGRALLGFERLSPLFQARLRYLRPGAPGLGPAAAAVAGRTGEPAIHSADAAVANWPGGTRTGSAELRSCSQQ